MTVTPAARPAQPAVPARSDAAPRPAREIVDRFAAAVRQGAVPLPADPQARPVTIGVTLPAPPPPRAPGLPTTVADAAPRRPRLDPETPDLTLAAGALAAPAGMAVAAPPPAAVDPSAFADLVNQLWLREQQKTTRELRVRFGEGAWPATGARLLRHDDGSFGIEVSVGRHSQPGDVDALYRTLVDRGLPVASVTIAQDS